MADPISMAFTVASTVVGMATQVMGGIAANNQAKHEARQMERQAMARRAEGSRAAAEEARQRELVMSEARAEGAASGAGRAFDLEGDIAKEGEYRKLTAVFNAETDARSFEDKAAARRYDGKVAKIGGFMGAAATGLKGAASMYNNYGGGGAPTGSAAPSSSPVPTRRPGARYSRRYNAGGGYAELWN